MNNQQEKTLLSPEFVRLLKSRAHHLNPVIQLGKKGVNEPLLLEIERALNDHELIKLKFVPEQKEFLSSNLKLIFESTGASHISTIGNIVILFRKKEKGSKFDI